MTLAWPLALIGLAAIPLLILLERWRRRPRARIWPSLLLWRAIAETAAPSRRRVSRPLVLECVAVGLLSFAAAGPAVGSDSASQVLVLLDDGLHMQARLGDGRTAEEATLAELPAGVRIVRVRNDLLAAAAAQPGPFVLATNRADVESPRYTVVGRKAAGVNVGIDAVSVKGDTLWFALATDGEPRTVSVRVGASTMQVRTGVGVTIPFAPSIRIEVDDNYAPDNSCTLRRPSIVVRCDSDSRFLQKALGIGIRATTEGEPDLVIETNGGEAVGELVHGSDCVVGPGLFDGLVLDGCVWRSPRGRAHSSGDLLSFRGRALAAWLDPKTLWLGLPMDPDWDDQGTLAVLIDRAKRLRAPLSDGEVLVGDAACLPAPGAIDTRGVDRPWKHPGVASDTARDTRDLTWIAALCAAVVLAFYLRAIVRA